MEYRNISEQIDRFSTQQARLATRGWRCEDIGEYAVLLHPPGVTNKPFKAKEIPLTVMGITHGNEWAGIGAINDILDHLYFGTITLPFSVAFILGNPWAARQNRRFIDKDLNRSFGALGGTALEQKRAKKLAPILEKSAYLIDLHQTREHTADPFYIFPYSLEALKWAQDMAPHIPVVTHWGDSFSKEGMCTDEYTNSHGGIGLSIELGQNSFHPYHMGIGLRVIMGAMTTVSAKMQGISVERLMPATSEIFTWNAVVEFPEGRKVGMDPGWFNFREVTEGEHLGDADGRPILAPASGKVLFPQIHHTENRPRPAELCRILRPVAYSELP